MQLNKIYNMPAEEFLSTLEPEVLDLTITSPPYDDLRKYNGFAFNMEIIVPALYKSTKWGG